MEPGELAVGAGHAVVAVDRLGLDPEAEQTVALSGQIVDRWSTGRTRQAVRPSHASRELGPVEPQDAAHSNIRQHPTSPAGPAQRATATPAAPRMRIGFRGCQLAITTLGSPQLVRLPGCGAAPPPASRLVA